VTGNIIDRIPIFKLEHGCQAIIEEPPSDLDSRIFELTYEKTY